MSAEPKPEWTVKTYLEFERASEEKHEYLDGEVFLLAGTSRNHNLIAGNTYASLHGQLRERACIVYSSDMRVKVSKKMYTYPDVTVMCGEEELEDEHQDNLLNPTVIIEVLSPSTERYDRGKKFQHYRNLPSLREYVLISQDSYRIEVYRLQEQWVLYEVEGIEAAIDLTSINCRLTLNDVYEKVNIISES